MVTRRALLGGLATAVIACDRHERAAPGAASSAPPPVSPEPPLAPAVVEAAARVALPPQPDRGAVETRILTFDRAHGGPQQAVVVVPTWAASGERFPLLVALAGMGETRRGMVAASWGWMKDYWLDRAVRRLRSPPLMEEDFEGLVTEERLAAINTSLVARPFRGLVVACPFTPDLLAEQSLDNAGDFARFVSKQLLPRVRAEAPVVGERAATGIDGISLGGRLALLVALARRDTFAAVGSMQGAFDLDEVGELGARTANALRREGSFKLRLLTSEKDPFRDAIGALHRMLASRRAEHGHVVLPGPHDYRFNRGPAAIEMLLWHDRVLRGEEG